MLSAEQIHRLLGGLQERSGWEAVEECTFDAAGRVTEKLQALKQEGVTASVSAFRCLTMNSCDATAAM
jgi:coproporphyrinogen III oxidase-like Fe-S oxidoreductase